MWLDVLAGSWLVLCALVLVAWGGYAIYDSWPDSAAFVFVIAVGTITIMAIVQLT